MTTVQPQPEISRRRYPVWQYTPMREFLSRSDLWMYRSFAWSLGGVTAALYFAPMLFFMAAPGQTSPGYVVAALASSVIGIVLVITWIHRGVDLRRRPARIQVVALLVPLCVQIGIATTHPTVTQIVVTVAIAGASLLVATILGPLWIILVYVAAMGAIGFAMKLAVYESLLVCLYAVFAWVSAKMTFWYINVLNDLTAARHTERRLAISEERVRFAADLHDVIGRNLSIISMQVELADQLVARGDSRAREHLQEVRHTAATAMTQMRSLVRGYREPTFDDELRGARVLLDSAGIDLIVKRSAQPLAPAAEAMMAYLVREAVTNILRHSQAQQVVIEIEPRRIRVSNDHPLGLAADLGNGKIMGTDNGTGLATLRRKLEESGLGSAADLQVESDAQRFTISMELPGVEGK